MFKPLLKIFGRLNGGAVVCAKIEFDDFNMAMEFNALIVDFLISKRKIGGLPPLGDFPDLPAPQERAMMPQSESTDQSSARNEDQ